MYSFLFLEHIREFFEHDGILGSESQFITQRIRDAAPFLNAHVLSALRMGECTARDLCTVRQGLLSDVTRVAVELRTLRRARNITQQTLADRAQVARRTLTHAESAQNVGIQEWCRIANALGYELTLRPQNTVVFEELPDVFKEEE